MRTGAKLEIQHFPAHLHARRPQRNGEGALSMRLPGQCARNAESWKAGPCGRRRYSRSELHTAAEMLRKLQRGEDLRTARVAEVREAIAWDVYEHAMKLDVAVDRLLEELREDMGGE